MLCWRINPLLTKGSKLLQRCLLQLHGDDVEGHKEHLCSHLGVRSQPWMLHPSPSLLPHQDFLPSGGKSLGLTWVFTLNRCR